VLVVYYEPETSVGLSTNACATLGINSRGAGLSHSPIGTPGGNAWKPETGAAQCQPLVLSCLRCCQLLLGSPACRKVDRGAHRRRGHSYGGKWALFAAALWDRFAAVAVATQALCSTRCVPT